MHITWLCSFGVISSKAWPAAFNYRGVYICFTALMWRLTIVKTIDSTFATPPSKDTDKAPEYCFPHFLYFLYNLFSSCSDCLNSNLILSLFYWLRCIMWFRSEVMAAILDFTSQQQWCSSIFLPDKSDISVISCQRPSSVSLIVYWISSVLKNKYFMPFRKKHCCAFE